jgi:hypothetical protein
MRTPAGGSIIKSIQTGSATVSKTISSGGGAVVSNFPLSVAINSVNVDKSVVSIAGGSGKHYGYETQSSGAKRIYSLSPYAALTASTTLTIGADGTLNLDDITGSVTAVAKWTVTEYY